MPFMKCISEGLTPELIQKAKEELGETEEVKQRCLIEIKKLIEEEPDFYPCQDDAFLLRFLRGKKYDVERAFKTLKNFYILKARYSGIISGFLPSEMRKVMEVGQISCLEYRDDDGAAWFVGRIGHFDIDKFTLEDELAYGLLISEIISNVEATQIAGYGIILDYADFTLRKAIHFLSPRSIKLALTVVSDAVPNRIKTYHIINQPFFFDQFLKIAWPFMPEKLKERLHIHGKDLNKLHQYVSPEILPEELGGKQGPMKKFALEFAENVLLQNEEHFIRMNSYGYRNETLEKIQKKNFST